MILNPRTQTMGVIHQEEIYGGRFQIDLPLSGGVPIKRIAANIERSDMSAVENNLELTI